MKRILVTGGAKMRTSGMTPEKYFSKRVGEVDEKSIKLALDLGLNVAGGSLGKKSGRVMLSTRHIYPGAHANGYALRSRVIWWLNTGEVVDKNTDLHYKNRNKIDDRFENLEKLDHSKHSQLHNSERENKIKCVCKECGIEFFMSQWQVDGSRGKFCSQDCYHGHKRSEEHKKAISDGLKKAYKEGRR